MTSRRHRLTRRSLIAATLASAAVSPVSTFARTPAKTSSHKAAGNMQIRCAFDDQTFTVTLDDNPTVRDFVSMLPLDLSIEDYSTNEKIAYLPRKLTEEGSGPFSNESAGDFCYFAPWGNLVFYHAGYPYWKGLIRLGRLDGGVAPLLKRGKFPLRIEVVSQP
jgi:hypothetical protein